MEQDNSKPQPGDLIEIDGTLHQHWALYMGDGYVINLLPVGKREVKQEGLKVTVFIRTVKKELLTKVAGNDQWRVNNKSDQDHTPLPVEKIISRAEAYIGKEVTYCSFGSNCERFVKKLRYGEGVSEQWRASVGGEMHILDMRDDDEYPKPGDLIEIKQGRYDHWALYMGDGYVIYVTPVGAPSLSGSSDTRLMRKAKVKKEPLKEVAGNDAWAVNNKYDCHCTPVPVKEIIQSAEDCVGKELTYDVFKSKADDFVTKLRYGDQFRAFEGDDIYHHDLINRKYLPIPGDLIEIKRGGYQHWALYMGRGYVIHVTDVGSTDVSSGSVSSVLGQAIVKIEPLEKVVKNSLWHVNNKYDKYRKPCPVEEIMLHAEVCVGEKVRYGLFRNNCEHFVTKLRYGKAVSGQVIKGAFGLATLAGVALILI